MQIEDKRRAFVDRPWAVVENEAKSQLVSEIVKLVGAMKCAVDQWMAPLKGGAGKTTRGGGAVYSDPARWQPSADGHLRLGGHAPQFMAEFLDTELVGKVDLSRTELPAYWKLRTYVLQLLFDPDEGPPEQKTEEEKDADEIGEAEEARMAAEGDAHGGRAVTCRVSVRGCAPACRRSCVRARAHARWLACVFLWLGQLLPSNCCLC